MIRTNEELTQATSDQYIEEWTVVINKNEYILNKSQSELLRKEIASGNRGTIIFKDFAIPIPYVEEFFRSKKELNPNRQLATIDTDSELDADEWLEKQSRLAEIRRQSKLKTM